LAAKVAKEHEEEMKSNRTQMMRMTRIFTDLYPHHLRAIALYVMALIDCKFYSETLELSTSMLVILPQPTQTQIGMQNVATAGKHKTLYLLHGLSDDHSIWLRRTSIERYVAPLGLAVVMPAVHRSFYTDMAYGGAYETFVAQELPRLPGRSFRFPINGRIIMWPDCQWAGMGPLSWHLITLTIIAPPPASPAQSTWRRE